MDEIHIRTMQGMLKLQSLCKTLGIRKITDEERRGFCHNLTSDVLIANKNYMVDTIIFPFLLQVIWNIL